MYCLLKVLNMKRKEMKRNRASNPMRITTCPYIEEND